MLEDFTIETFSGRLGERFRVAVDAGAALGFDTELTEVTSLGAARDASARQPFSLVFRAAGNELVPQRIYRMEHEAIGAFELFLVPLGPDGEGMRYEAVFT